MNTPNRSLMLALSMMVLSTIGLASCGSSSTSNNDGSTGGSSGAVGGSSGAGGASSAGGSTGAGGRTDAGTDTRTGAGGASGTDSGSGGCADLLACCNSGNASQAQLMALCLQEYNNAKSMGDAACSNVLQMIKNNGLCN